MSRKTRRQIALLLLGSAVWGSGFAVMWNLADPIAAVLIGGALLAIAMVFVVPWAVGPALVAAQDRRHLAAQDRVRQQLTQTAGAAGTSPTNRRTGSQPRHRVNTGSTGRHAA